MRISVDPRGLLVSISTRPPWPGRSLREPIGNFHDMKISFGDIRRIVGADFFDFREFPGFTPWDMVAARKTSLKELIENSRSTKRDLGPLGPSPYAVHWCIELTENNLTNGPQKRRVVPVACPAGIRRTCREGFFAVSIGRWYQWSQ